MIYREEICTTSPGIWRTRAFDPLKMFVDGPIGVIRATVSTSSLGILYAARDPDGSVLLNELIGKAIKEPNSRFSDGKTLF